jgi:hypothetical protein
MALQCRSKIAMGQPVRVCPQSHPPARVSKFFHYLLAQSWTRAGSNWQIYSDKCLDVTGGSTANGNKMQIWTCGSGDPNQEFTTSGNTIQWSGKGECLDLTNGVLTDGNVVRSFLSVFGQ